MRWLSPLTACTWIQTVLSIIILWIEWYVALIRVMSCYSLWSIQWWEWKRAAGYSFGFNLVQDINCILIYASNTLIASYASSTAWWSILGADNIFINYAFWLYLSFAIFIFWLRYLIFWSRTNTSNSLFWVSFGLLVVLSFILNRNSRFKFLYVCLLRRYCFLLCDLNLRQGLFKIIFFFTFIIYLIWIICVATKLFFY